MSDYRLKTQDITTTDDKGITDNRTAVVTLNNIASFFIVDTNGNELVMLNVCHDNAGWLNVDVIDRKSQYSKKRMLGFKDGGMTHNVDMTGHFLVAVEFSKKEGETK